MRAKCGTCGTLYDGWECPMCKVKEQTEQATDRLKELNDQSRKSNDISEKILEQQESSLSKTLEGIQEARSQIEDSIAEAQYESQLAQEETVRKIKQTVSQDWKLRAGEKVRTALELYRAGMRKDADRLTTEAYTEDPSNIEAYALKAKLIQGEKGFADAAKFLDRVLALLSAETYANDTDAYVDVLDLIRSEAEFQRRIPEFCEILLSNQPRGRGNDLEIVNRLLALNVNQESCEYFQLLHPPPQTSLKMQGSSVPYLNDDQVYLFEFDHRLGEKFADRVWSDDNLSLSIPEPIYGTPEDTHKWVVDLLNKVNSNGVFSAEAQDALSRALNKYISIWNQRYVKAEKDRNRKHANSQWAKLFVWRPVLGFFVGMITGCIVMGGEPGLSVGAWSGLAGSLGWGIKKYNDIKNAEVKLCAPL